MTRNSLNRRLRKLGLATIVSMICGVLFGATLEGAFSWASAWRSVQTAILIGTPIFSFEFLYLNTSAGAWLRRLPFSVFVLARFVAWAGWIYVATRIAQALVWEADGSGDDSADYWWTVLFSFAFGFTISVVAAVDRLLGRGVLGNFLLGRYHHPREERRAVLFIDLVGSTAIAERIGPARFLELLNRFAYEVSAAVEGTGGSIHAYVGDEVILTWRIDPNTDLTPAVATVFRLRDRMVDLAERFETDFGMVPRFRAALHEGPVVAGEIGDDKRDIVFLGDTMNTTARMEQLCREVDEPFLVSAEAMSRVDVPDGIVVKTLEPMIPRGKSSAIHLVALSRVEEVGPDVRAERTGSRVG